MTKSAEIPDPARVRAAAAAGSLGDVVESALAVLVGEPMSSLGRAADMGDFGFGPFVTAPTKRDPLRTGPTFVLHLQCPFRFSGPDGPILGSRDMYRGVDGSWIEGEWTGKEPNFFDAAVHEYIKRRGDDDVVCERVESNRAGDLTISLTEGHALEVFVPGAVRREYWRFYRLGDTSRHLVIVSDDE